MAETPAYKTIYFGSLVQRSSLSIGGTREDSPIDDPFCRDGLGRPTLRGTGLGGAFFDTLRKTGVTVPLAFTKPVGKDGTDWYGESLVRFWNSHPGETWSGAHGPGLEPRQGVGIRQDTGAARQGALYDFEVAPVGLDWPIVIELDVWRIGRLPEDLRGTRDDFERLVELALSEWVRGRCWIGRGPARGLGWMQLAKAQRIRLHGEHAAMWPNGWLIQRKPGQPGLRRSFGEFVKAVTGSVQSVLQIGASTSEKERAWHYVRLTGEATTGMRSDGYGLNSLSIGGHDMHLFKGAFKKGYTYVPSGMKPGDYEAGFSPDFSIVMSQVRRQPARAWEPIIPGSAIRGPLRHALSHDLRADKESIRDPLTGDTYDSAASPSGTPDTIEQMFGTAGDREGPSSRVLIRDAFLSPESAEKWRIALLQRHAEDEFTAGVFHNSKFDRLALLEGKFEWEIVVEAPAREQAEAIARKLEERLKRRGGRALPIGGGVWRGHGWLEWTVKPLEHAAAGGDWEPLEAPEAQTEQPIAEEAA
jgi:CRISPR/Cas system CSM-associated protein Csm3 (group 7 of RAMP superfamily)